MNLKGGEGGIPLIVIATHAMTADILMKGQLSFLRRRGFDVTVVASPGPELDRVAEREGVRVVGVPIEREIRPIRDLLSLARLVQVLRRIRPQIVNAGTPKAGLLGMIASLLVRVPVRIYTLRGLRLETVKPGAKKVLLAFAETLAAASAHRVLSVSDSLKAEFVGRGFAPWSKVIVLGDGSSNGVEMVAYRDRGERLTSVARATFSLPAHDPLIGFVGRLTKDKGVVELVEAFDLVLATYPAAKLVLAGTFEPGDPVPQAVVDRIRTDRRILHVGWVAEPEKLFPAFSVFAFPSHREGFPNAPLQAAVAGIPTVGYRVTGTVDAVLDGETGSLCERGDVAGFAQLILEYITNSAVASAHGSTGRLRAEKSFSRPVVWKNIEEFYLQLLDSIGGHSAV